MGSTQNQLLSQSEKDYKEQIDLGLADYLPKVQENVKKYLSAQGMKNSFHANYLKTASENREYLNELYPTKPWTDGDPDNDTDMIRRRWINNNPSLVISEGMLDAFSTSLVKKFTRGKKSSDELATYAEQYVNSLTANYDFSNEDKSKSEEDQMIFEYTLNRSTTPKKVRDNVFTFTSFGETNTNLVPITGTGNKFDKAVSGMGMGSLEVEAYRLASDYSGLGDGNKYLKELQDNLSSNVMYNDDGFPVDENGNVTQTPTTYETVSLTDRVAQIGGVVTGMVISMAAEQAAIAGITLGATALSAPIGGAAGPVALVSGETVAVANAAKNVYKFGNLVAGVGKATLKTKAILNAAKMSASVQMGLRSAAMSVTSSSGSAVGERSLIGNDEMETKYGTIAAEAIWGFVSAYSSDKIAGGLLSKVTGKLSNVKTYKEVFNVLESSGMDKQLAFQTLIESEKLAAKVTATMARKGLAKFTTTGQIVDLVNKEISGNVISQTLRKAGSSYLGRQGVEMIIDGTMDFSAAEVGNRVWNSMTGENLFSAGTNALTDLNSDTWLQQIGMYGLMQGTMRATGPLLGVGLGKAQQAGSSVWNNGFKQSVFSGFKDMKGYNLANANVGLSIKEVTTKQVFQTMVDETLDAFIVANKLDENNPNIMQLSRHFISSYVADKIASNVSDDGMSSETLNVAQNALMKAEYDNSEINGKLQFKNNETRSEDILKLTNHILDNSMTNLDVPTVDKDLTIANIYNTLASINMGKTDQGIFRATLMKESDSRKADKAVSSAINDFFSSGSTNVKKQSTVSKKGISELFGESVTEIDLGKLISDNIKTLGIIDALPIPKEQQDLFTSLIGTLNSSMESDMALRDAMSSGSVSVMKNKLDTIGKYFKLDPEGKSAITNAMKILGDNGIAEKDRLFNAKDLIIHSADIFNEKNVSRVSAILSKSVKEYIDSNVEVFASKAMTDILNSDIDNKEQNEKFFSLVNYLKPQLSDDFNSKVGMLQKIVSVVPIATGQHTKEEVSIYKANAESWMSTYKDYGKLAVNAMINQVGFKDVDPKHIAITSNGSPITVSKDILSEQIGLTVRKQNLSEQVLGDMLTSSVIKTVMSGDVPSGKFKKVVHVGTMLDTKNDLFAKITGDIPEDGQAKIDVSYYALPTKPGMDYESITEKELGNYKVSLSSMFNGSTREDVITPLPKNNRNLLYTYIENAAITSKDNDDMDAFLSTVDLDHAVFIIGKDTYMFDSFKDELGIRIADRYAPLNSIVQDIMASSKSAFVAENILNTMVKSVFPEAKEGDVSIPVFVKQLLFEAMNKRGLDKSVTISEKGQVRNVGYSVALVRTFGNRRLSVFDVTIDMDKEAGLDANGKKKKLKDRNKAVEDKLKEADIIKLDIGFGNNIKSTYIRVNNLNKSKELNTARILLRDVVTSRISSALYPKDAEVYKKMLGKLDSKGWQFKYDEVLSDVLTFTKAKHTAALNDIFDKHSDKLGSIKDKHDYNAYDQKEVSIYSEDSDKIKSLEALNRNDPIIGLYKGLKDSIGAIEASEKLLKGYGDNLDKVRGMYYRFLLMGTDTFSIKDPSKRGMLFLQTDNVDNKSESLKLSMSQGIYMDKVISGENKLYFAYSRTQDGMSFLPKEVYEAWQSFTGDTNSKYVSNGWKGMTTDTDQIAGERLITQKGEVTVGPNDFIIDMGGMKLFDADVVRLVMKSVGEITNGNAIMVNPTKLNKEDQFALKQLFGKLATQNIMKTSTKMSGVSKQAENTTHFINDVSYQTGAASMGLNIRSLGKAMSRVNRLNAYMNPSLYLKEFASVFSKNKIPTYSCPSRVKTRLGESDFTFVKESEVPYTVNFGTKKIVKDLVFFTNNDDVLKKYSEQMFAVTSLIQNMKAGKVTSEEELQSVVGMIKEMDKDFVFKTKTDADVIEFAMDVLSNQVLMNDRNERMYARVNGEYYTVVNRNPITLAGQQDFNLITGIRRGGSGAELSVDAYSKVGGGDYDGDGVGGFQASTGIINKLYGKDNFKSILINRQNRYMKQSESIKSIYGNVKPIIKTFTSEDTLKNSMQFNGLPVEFGEIPSNSGLTIGARLVADKSKILVNLQALREKYKAVAWTKPYTLTDGSSVTPFAEDTFKTFNQWLSFVMLHEFAHKDNDKLDGETRGDYENRINDIAMTIYRKGSPTFFMEGTETQQDIPIENYLGGIKHLQYNLFDLSRKLPEGERKQIITKVFNSMIMSRVSSHDDTDVIMEMMKSDNHLFLHEIPSETFTTKDGLAYVATSLTKSIEIDTGRSVDVKRIVVYEQSHSFYSNIKAMYDVPADVNITKENIDEYLVPEKNIIGNGKYVVHSPASIGHQIGEAAVSNVKTSIIQYLDYIIKQANNKYFYTEKERINAQYNNKEISIEERDNDLKGISEERFAPAQFAAKYMDGFVSAVGDIYGVGEVNYKFNDYQKIIKAFDSDTEMSGADVLAVAGLLDGVTDKDMEMAPSVLRLAIDKREAMKRAGIWDSLQDIADIPKNISNHMALLHRGAIVSDGIYDKPFELSYDIKDVDQLKLEVAKMLVGEGVPDKVLVSEIEKVISPAGVHVAENELNPILIANKAVPLPVGVKLLRPIADVELSKIFTVDGVNSKLLTGETDIARYMYNSIEFSGSIRSLGLNLYQLQKMFNGIGGKMNEMLSMYASAKDSILKNSISKTKEDAEDHNESARKVAFQAMIDFNAKARGYNLFTDMPTTGRLKLNKTANEMIVEYSNILRAAPGSMKAKVYSAIIRTLTETDKTIMLFRNWNLQAKIIREIDAESAIQATETTIPGDVNSKAIESASNQKPVKESLKTEFGIADGVETSRDLEFLSEYTKPVIPCKE